MHLRVWLLCGARRRPAIAIALALLVSTLAPGLGASRGSREQQRTVVVVAGLTGSELVDSDTGEMVWGRGRNLFFPADGGYRLAAPLTTGGRDSLRPGATIDRVRFGPFSKPIYAPLASRLQQAGWLRGNLRRPASGENFFFYSYDWRHDNSVAAIELGHQLNRLAARSAGTLPVTLICQSNGAHICRYLVKYGTAPLEHAERLGRRALRGVDIKQVILVAAANGGSIRTLRQLNTSRRYLAGVGRVFQPEVSFTFASIYQSLPSYRDDLFVDPQGNTIAVDLFDVADWEHYGWSVFGSEVAARIEWQEELFGDLEARRSFLARALDRARRMQNLLRRETDIGQAAYFAIQNDRLPTLERAVVRQAESGWETLFAGDKNARNLEIAPSLLTAGDGHAPIASQRWLSRREIEAFAAPPFIVDGKHFQLIIKAQALDHVLEICQRPMAFRAPVIEAGTH